MADGVTPEGAIGANEQVPASEPTELDDKTKWLKGLLSSKLGQERAGELMPDGKQVDVIVEENYGTVNRPDEGFYTDPDGRIYTIRFSDGSGAYFTYAKTRDGNPWANWSGMGGADMRIWSVNNSATWNGKDTMELVIPKGMPTKDGPVVEKTTATFDGVNTTFSTVNPDGTTTVKNFQGDYAKPEPLLEQWRLLVRGEHGVTMPKKEFSRVPASQPSTPSIPQPAAI